MKILELPPFFDESLAETVWKVDYQTRFQDALKWREKCSLQPKEQDKSKVCLFIIDNQNTFCIPGFELYVGGLSGKAAVEDTKRLVKFIYHNLGIISEIIPTMDTHLAMQIFHPLFLIDKNGKHPSAMTLISLEDIKTGKWKINPLVVKNIGMDNHQDADDYLEYYVEKLGKSGKYVFTVWPFHAMLGGIGHSLVSLLEEAIFFHTVARNSQPQFELKGKYHLTENYSVIKPEVLEDSMEKPIAKKNMKLIQKLLSFDFIIIAGQAKSHCVAWTIQDLLDEIKIIDKSLAKKVYILEDCTSPITVPGVIDFTEAANQTFQRFASAGMNIVNTTEDLTTWKGFQV